MSDPESVVEKMKKIILALVLIIGSAGYVFVERTHEASQARAVDTTTTEPSVPTATVATPSTITAAPVPKEKPAAVSGMYTDGTYTGSVADAYYGNIQVAAVVAGGKLADVKVLQYPNDRRESLQISNQALPVLVREAISAQSAKVNAISGATDTSAAFTESLGTALSQAKA